MAFFDSASCILSLFSFPDMQDDAYRSINLVRHWLRYRSQNLVFDSYYAASKYGSGSHVVFMSDPFNGIPLYFSINDNDYAIYRRFSHLLKKHFIFNSEEEFQDFFYSCFRRS